MDLFEGFDKGKPVPHERVAAVFKVGDNYVFRQRCAKGAKRLGTTVDYSFPGLDRFSKAADFMTAMVAASHWGYDVRPVGLFYRATEAEPNETITRRYVVCEVVGEVPFKEEWRAEQRLFLPYGQALADSRVHGYTKRALEQIEPMFLRSTG